MPDLPHVRRLGVDTVAVAEPDDRRSLHARSAAQTIEISSYLDPVAVIGAAREARADAVHPGYGFLAESPELAEAVAAAGLTWVGPSPEAMRRGGNKVSANAIAREAGVPIAPQGAPEEMPLPFVVKSAAGGGGRGMRVVRTRAETETAIADASREAEAAFGDGTVFCEPYRERARHVEAQLVGHSAGVTVIGLRDCSLQRRHQKVIEEAPPPSLDPRAESAIRAGAASVRRGDRVREPRNGRVPRRWPGRLLPGAERADPGRASGDRGAHRARPRRAPAPDRGGRPCLRRRARNTGTQSKHACTRRIRRTSSPAAA